jgi:hypothetical protein
LVRGECAHRDLPRPRPLTAADRAAGVTWQGRARLGDKWQGEPVRVVKVEVDGKILLLATDLKMEAELIALIYRYRWQVELFFKWLKSILGCRHLMAESPEGVAIQLYSALIAALMLQLLTGKRPGKRAMELLRFYMMGYAELDERLARMDAEPSTRVPLPAILNPRGPAAPKVRAVIHAGNGLTWSQVLIEIAGDQTIRLRAPGQDGTHSLSKRNQLGPEHPLGILMTLAAKGEWRNPPSSSPDYERVCKAFQRLQTLLRTLVPLPGKPFQKSAGAFVPIFQVQIHSRLRDGDP